MLLRRLEAYGFKSFAEKTELEFGRGLTAIVGPNGSGKSNISDAIRWALGEQSLRALRGARMEDVIFAGSANRKPLGAAEVSLVFDNSDGKLALDFNEITITRRVFRSGDSEYYINKTACRLKDIHDLLADTGLGRESMTVIGQNKVDEILSSKPEERRLLFEEAAGITKNKQRKRDSLRKLAETDQNLIRVSDITSELENQLEPLQQSAARTVAYNKLKEELLACRATVLIARLEKAEKLVESGTLEQNALTDQSIAVDTRLVSTDNEKEELTLRVAAADEQLAGIEQELNKIATEIERIDSRKGILSERIEQARKAEVRLNETSVRLVAEQQAAGVKLAEFQSSLEMKQRKVQTLKQMVCEKTSSNEQRLAQIRQIEQQIEQGQEQMLDYLQQSVNERNRLRMHERDLAALAVRQNKLNHEAAGYKDQQLELNTKKTQLTEEAACITARQQALAAQMAAQRQDLEQLDARLKHVTEKEHQLAGKLNQTASRLTVLQSMQDEMEGFGRAIKGLLKNNSAWRQGICGAVAQLFAVPDKYVNAIEAALGGAQQHLVTDTDEVAKQAIGFLKTQNLGRATFLPLNTIKIARPREVELLAASQKGAIGFAAAVVTADERFRPVIDYLLGRVIIAKTIDDALRIARNSNFSTRIVTLGGDLVNPGGSMSGGSAGRKEASFIARNNEIDVLKQSLSSFQAEQVGHEQERAAVNVAMAEINENLASLETRYQEAGLRQSQLTIYIDKIESEGARCDLALKTISDEAAECQGETGVCRQKIAESKVAIDFLENQETSHKSLVADWQNRLKEIKVEHEALSEEVVNVKVKLSASEQEVAAARFSWAQYQEIQLSLDKQLASLQSEADQLQDELGQAQAELAALMASQEQLRINKMQLADDRQVQYAAKLELLAGMQRLDKEIKELRRQSTELRGRLHEIELIITKYGYEVANCHEQLGGQLGLSLDEARGLKRQESMEQLIKTISRTESQIAELGPVNPAAIDEYHRVQERYDFLQEQTADLLRAKDYLTSVIQDIDTTMSRQFNKAFRAISQYFGEVFVRLFGGGRAELVLVEPGNILETGIDIIVQPPGKKLQNLALLSGGERALTVIALLFAILSYRPAPFCVIDEVDAALDEANVQRFSEFLRDYAQNTQFIVVTHRKGTMEAAGVLHGVTMEESGISRLVSVKFSDRVG